MVFSRLAISVRALSTPPGFDLVTNPHFAVKIAAPQVPSDHPLHARSADHCKTREQVGFII
jgi:hypothetical protein